MQVIKTMQIINQISQIKEYAEICLDFAFYYTNGIPKDAKQCCLECINLDESKISEESHDTNNFHCEIREREVKHQTYKQSLQKEQTHL